MRVCSCPTSPPIMQLASFRLLHSVALSWLVCPSIRQRPTLEHAPQDLGGCCSARNCRGNVEEGNSLFRTEHTQRTHNTRIISVRISDPYCSESSRCAGTMACSRMRQGTRICLA